MIKKDIIKIIKLKVRVKQNLCFKYELLKSNPKCNDIVGLSQKNFFD